LWRTDWAMESFICPASSSFPTRLPGVNHAMFMSALLQQWRNVTWILRFTLSVVHVRQCFPGLLHVLAWCYVLYVYMVDFVHSIVLTECPVSRC
jgi:hypothetical protein